MPILNIDIIDICFEENLDLVKDEHPDLILNQQLNIAREYTIEDLTGIVDRIVENRKAGHQDLINKTFFI